MSQLFNSKTIKQYIDALSGKIVFTNGCFDILHPGHIRLLSDAKGFGDHLIVGVNSDDSIRKLKGSTRPINNEKFRATMLLGLKAVSAVVIFSEQTPHHILSQVKPAVHVKGGDYAATALPEYDQVIKQGGTVKIIPFLEGYSSTSVIQRIVELSLK